MENNEIEITFGANDSELIESTYHIPDGMEAIIEGDKVIIRKKESEDEKTRKEIYRYLYNELHNIDQLTPRTNTFEMWLAWLEKQGEKTVIGNGSNSASVSDGDNSVTSKEVVSQQTGWSKEDTDFKTESVRYLCNLRDTFEENKWGTKPIQRCINWLLEFPKPQPKQELSEEDVIKKHITNDSISEVVNDRLNKCGWYITEKHSNLESIGEEWSEEDEENLYLTIAAIEKKYSGELFLDKKKVKEQEGTGRKLLDWLYSFQDRVKPQPKQDWSEEDEEEWKSIVSVLTRMHFLDELDWLRSKLKR